MKTILFPLAALLLAACALTPEQRARREAEQKAFEQDLQVELASRCDNETASLLRRHFDGNTGRTAAEQKAFKARYSDKTSDPLFQSCYKMAWQTYLARQELREMRYRYRYWDDFYHPFPSPFHRPFFW